MPERSEIIAHFRHLISSRYKVYGWIAGAIWMIGLLMYGWFEPVSFYRSIISGIQLLGMLLLWHCFNHRYWMLYHFNTRDPNPLEQLESYFEKREKQWDNSYLLRMGMMSLLALTMILLLFFERESRWAGITATLFLALTLALIIKMWLDFNDNILLHDIRRSLRDQPSE